MWDALSDWRNKFSFVDGRMEVPDEDDLNQKEWERCNNLVHSWIMNSVSDSIAQGIVFFENVVDVWCDLFALALDDDVCAGMRNACSFRLEEQIMQFLTGSLRKYSGQLSL